VTILKKMIVIAILFIIFLTMKRPASLGQKTVDLSSLLLVFTSNNAILWSKQHNNAKF